MAPVKVFVLSALAAVASAASTDLQTSFPKSSGTTALSAAKTIAAGASFDGGMKQWDRSTNTCKGQKEGGDADAVFLLQEGSTLSNVIIGPNNGEGVHCLGSCTLNNVWWTDVCEDAATFKQSGGTSYVNGGGARNADDKVLQHNGAGTVAVKNFWVNKAGKVYRSCGNCSKMYARHSTFSNIYSDGAGVVAGVNGNYGDTTYIHDSCVKNGKLCYLYKGNSNGDEPTKTGSAPSGTACTTAAIKTSC